MEYCKYSAIPPYYMYKAKMVLNVTLIRKLILLSVNFAPARTAILPWRLCLFSNNFSSNLEIIVARLTVFTE